MTTTSDHVDVDGNGFAAEVGARLRAVRRARGLSLAEVGQRFGYRASTVGAWERAARTLNVPQLHQVAAFYDVPVATLLGDRPATGPGRRRVVLDLEALRGCPDAALVEAFARQIVLARGDFNGQVLTLRHDDLPAICALVGADTPVEAFKQLDAWGVLLVQ